MQSDLHLRNVTLVTWQDCAKCQARLKSLALGVPAKWRGEMSRARTGTEVVGMKQRWSAESFLKSLNWNQ